MFRRERVLRGKVLERFVVTTTNGQVFSGLLEEFDELTFVFADVKLMQQGFVPAEGRIYIDRRKVDYMQRVVANAVV